MRSDTPNPTNKVVARGYCLADSLVNKHVMLGIVIMVMCSVWAYARFGGDVIGTSKTFIATPGFNFLHINVRSGPGSQYRIIETVPRGTLLTGIGRKTDSHGAFWIVLANGRGYVKESILSPCKGSAK